MISYLFTDLVANVSGGIQVLDQLQPSLVAADHFLSYLDIIHFKR
jgi:iron uptake system EfeUOB component EfeO/EfeM